MKITTLLWIPAFAGMTIGIACQRQPSIAPAAQPGAQKAVAPMGSQTNNGELEKKLAEFLDKNPKPSLKRDFKLAELYFYERRFIEAAHTLSSILDTDAKYPQARNLLARCFYFLGNPDRSIAELDLILTKSAGRAEDMLDALFLTGAVVLESNPSLATTQKGIAAWEHYLKIAPDSELRGQVKDGLVKLHQRLRLGQGRTVVAARHEGTLKAQGLAAFAANDFLLAEQKLQQASVGKWDPEIETTLARIAIRTNRPQEALKRFEGLVKKQPRYAPAWHYKGMAHMLVGDPRHAIDCWQRLVDQNPTYATEHRLTERIAIAKGML